jgi:hypothetical protein
VFTGFVVQGVRPLRVEAGPEAFLYVGEPCLGVGDEPCVPCVPGGELPAERHLPDDRVEGRAEP